MQAVAKSGGQTVIENRTTRELSTKRIEASTETRQILREEKL